MIRRIDPAGGLEAYRRLRLDSQMGLDRLFEVDDYAELSNHLPQILQLRVADLRKELNSIQWVGVQALLHPTASRHYRVQRFFHAWKTMGLR